MYKLLTNNLYRLPFAIIIFTHTYIYYFELKIDSSRGFVISPLSSKLNPNYIAYNCY